MGAASASKAEMRSEKASRIYRAGLFFGQRRLAFPLSKPSGASNFMLMQLRSDALQADWLHRLQIRLCNIIKYDVEQLFRI